MSSMHDLKMSLNEPLISELPRTEMNEIIDKYEGKITMTYEDLKKLLPIAFALFVSTITISYIFPFSGLILLNYDIINESIDAGYYNAYITGAYYVGRALTAA